MAEAISQPSSTPNAPCSNSRPKKNKFTPGRYCKAYGCTSSEYLRVDGGKVQSKITFFKVPKKVLENKKILKYWASLIKREIGKDNFTLGKNSVLCEKHFKESDIVRWSNGLRLKAPKLREGAAPVLHSWVVVKPERPAPKQRSCPPPKKLKGPEGLKKIAASEDGSPVDTLADDTAPDLQTTMDASGSGLELDDSGLELDDSGLELDESGLELDESGLDCRTIYSTSEVDTVSNTITVSPPPVKISVATQTFWTPVTVSTQTTSDCNASTAHDHVYTYVHGNSQTTSDCNASTAQTLDSYKHYVLKIEAKLQHVEEECENLKTSVQNLEAQLKEFKATKFCPHSFKYDDDSMKFYTGFPNFDMFMAVFEYLASKASHLQYWRSHKNVQDSKPYQTPGKGKPGPKRKLCLLDEFFVVLVRLKVGLFNKDLAFRFNISESTVSRIVNTWVNFLYEEIPLLFPFPTQEDIRSNMPLQFSQYPTTRVIIDCTEIFIQKPSAMLAQCQTWSNYKHHNTWKVLVGISPNGMVTFVSRLWGGRVSDKAITKKSGILDLLDEGDVVMADRGFEISDILPPGVSLNIPPFKGNRAALSAAEVEETMNVASVRIHVERAIGRVKNYHILDGVMPISLTNIADQIFTVCSYLTNFSAPLVKKDA